MTDLVKYEKKDAIILLTLNRPEKLNALNYAANDRLLELLDEIEDDRTIRAIVLTGAGDRAFSAGGDIHEFSQSVAAGMDVAVKDFCKRGQTMTSRLEAFPKPIIAAVAGTMCCSLPLRAKAHCLSRSFKFQKRSRNIIFQPGIGKHFLCQ